MIINHRVSYAFVQLADGSLGDFANGVITKLYSVPAFSAAPVTEAQLSAARDNFLAKLAETVNGGKLATAAKNQARAGLLAPLRQNASFVQTIAGTDLPLLLASGYSATNPNRASQPLPKPAIVNVDNFQSTMLMLAVKHDPNAKAYEAQYRVGAGEYRSGGVHTKSRRILVTSLVPGTVYELQVRAVGGSTGCSDWSDPVSHMAM